MLFKKKGVLGVVFGERSLFMAYVFLKGKSLKIHQAAEWVLPDDISDVEFCGKELQKFLRSRGIGASHAVAGIPANWLLAKHKKAPLTDEETLASVLKLEAEKDFSLRPEELLLDYIAASKPGREDISLLLLAANKKKVDFISLLFRKAGLKIIAATPSSLALMSPDAGSGNFAGLYIGKESVELAIFAGGIPLAVKHLGAEAGLKDSGAKRRFSLLSSEIRRIFTVFPNDFAGTSKFSEIIAWDDRGLTKEEVEHLKILMPYPVKFADSVKVLAGKQPDKECIPCNGPSSLARYSRDIRQIPGNFLDSHISVHSKFRWQKVLVKGTAAFAALLFIVFAAIADLKIKENEVEKLKKQMNSLSPELHIAKEALDYFAAMQEWRGEKMAFLECLREITLIFPAEGRIWVTSMGIRDNMSGLISGKADDSKAVLEIADALKQNERFSDINLLYIRHAGGASKEVVYAVNFVFRHNEKDGINLRGVDL